MTRLQELAVIDAAVALVRKKCQSKGTPRQNKDGLWLQTGHWTNKEFELFCAVKEGGCLSKT